MSEIYHEKVNSAIANGLVVTLNSKDPTLMIMRDGIYANIPNSSLWLDDQWVQTQKQRRVFNDTYREVYEPVGRPE